jgi:hypothetical protein
MTETRIADRVQEEILKTVRTSQAAVVDALETWATTVQTFTSTLPEMQIPFADKLPKPQEFVASSYNFAEQLLASQRKFTEDVIKATAPMLPGKDETPARKTASAAK